MTRRFHVTNPPEFLDDRHHELWHAMAMARERERTLREQLRVVQHRRKVCQPM